jgi:hypothetical protein
LRRHDFGLLEARIGARKRSQDWAGWTWHLEVGSNIALALVAWGMVIVKVENRKAGCLSRIAVV